VFRRVPNLRDGRRSTARASGRCAAKANRVGDNLASRSNRPPTAPRSQRRCLQRFDGRGERGRGERKSWSDPELSFAGPEWERSMPLAAPIGPAEPDQAVPAARVLRRSQGLRQYSRHALRHVRSGEGSRCCAQLAAPQGWSAVRCESTGRRSASEAGQQWPPGGNRFRRERSGRGA